MPAPISASWRFCFSGDGGVVVRLDLLGLMDGGAEVVVVMGEVVAEIAGESARVGERLRFRGRISGTAPSDRLTGVCFCLCSCRCLWIW